MSGISQPIQSLLTKLRTLQVLNQDNQTVNLYAAIYNNQRNRIKEGKSLALPLPAAFVEVIQPESYNELGNAVYESDLVFKIHLEHWFIDAQDGTYDQDFPIFDLRDNIITLLTNFRPTSCGNMFLSSISQDFEHDDVYVMGMYFTCGFIDDRGTATTQGTIIVRPAPVDLDLTVEFVNVPDIYGRFPLTFPITLR